MDAVDRELRYLAGIRSPADPVVSVHLDARWGDEHQRQRVRLFVEDAARRERARRPDDAAFGRTLDRVREYVEGLARQEYDVEANGVALFACEALGLFRAITVHQSFSPQRFQALDAPDVLPLVQMWGRFPPAAVALVDAHGARVIDTGLGEVVADGRVEGGAHRRHGMGGWAQARYQRHIRRQIQRNHREAAALLDTLLEEDPRQLFALAGPDRVIASFARELSPRVADRVFWTMPNPHERSDREARVRDELVQGLFDALVTRTRIDAERDVDGVVGAAERGVTACLGPGEVTLAANQGRVHRLLLHEDLRLPAWLCGRCDALETRSVRACAYCGGPVHAVPLGLELARKVLGAGGEVEIVETSPRLARYRGLAAILRPRGGAAADLGAQPH